VRTGRPGCGGPSAEHQGRPIHTTGSGLMTVMPDSAAPGQGSRDTDGQTIQQLSADARGRPGGPARASMWSPVIGSSRRRRLADRWRRRRRHRGSRSPPGLNPGVALCRSGLCDRVGRADG